MMYFKFILAVLAVYRLCHMLAVEDGPFDIFFRVREAVQNKFGPAHWVSRGFNCPLCMSFWVSLVTNILIFPGADFVTFCLYWLALTGGVSVIHMTIYRR